MSATTVAIITVLLLIRSTSGNAEDSSAERMAKCVEDHLGSECPSQKAHILDCAIKNGGKSLGRDDLEAALEIVESDGFDICPKLTSHVFLNILNCGHCVRSNLFIVHLIHVPAIIWKYV